MIASLALGVLLMAGQLVTPEVASVLSAQTVAKGSKTLGPFAAPKDAIEATIEIDGAAFALLDDTSRVTVVFEISFDAGVHWQDWGGSTYPGGFRPDDNGQLDTRLFQTMPVYQPGNPNRWVRGFVQLDKSALVTTGGSITWR